MHTVQHLVKHALNGELASKRTIVLVTHHIRLCLPIAAYIVELADGKVLRQGTPKDLRHFGMLDKLVTEEDQAKGDEGDAPISQPQENEADAAKVKPSGHGKNLTNGKLVEKEARAEGRISYRTYLTYLRAARMSSWIITFVLMLAIRAIDIGQQFFIAKWGEAYDEVVPKFTRQSSDVHISSSPLDRLPPPDVNPYPWFMVFLAISVVSSFVVLAYIALG